MAILLRCSPIVSLKALHAWSTTVDILLAWLYTLFVYQRRQRVYANFKQAERYSYTTTIELGLRIC